MPSGFCSVFTVQVNFAGAANTQVASLRLKSALVNMLMLGVRNCRGSCCSTNDLLRSTYLNLEVAGAAIFCKPVLVLDLPDLEGVMPGLVAL